MPLDMTFIFDGFPLNSIHINIGIYFCSVVFQYLSRHQAHFLANAVEFA